MGLSGKIVLIVDDEKDLCDIIAAELSSAGAQPVSVHNVAEARKYLAKSHVDLVVSDIRMPKASGVELLDSVEKSLPVVLMTGFSDITVPEALARGARAVVSKPFDLDELRRLCESLTS